MSDECHEETGQCNCKPGITGRDCSLCEKPNDVISFKGCQGVNYHHRVDLQMNVILKQIMFAACNDTCVQMLIEVVGNLSLKLVTEGETTLQGKLKLPWHLLNNIDENFVDVDNTYQSYLEFIKRLSYYNDRIEDDLKKKVKIAISKVRR